MKFLFSLSFLLFAAASSINASSFFAEGHPDPFPILDVEGAPLQFGAPYYVAPSIWAWGGGVSLEYPTPFRPCPKLIQLTHELDPGTPVVFSSAVQSVTGNITTESELIINFYNLTRPNDKYCGGSNSTTWMTTITRDLAVGREEMSTVFRVGRAWEGSVLDTYLLKPVIPFSKLHFVVGFGNGRNLMAIPYVKEEFNLSFLFRKAKNTEEDEDDKPVIIQMPRKMSA